MLATHCVIDHDVGKVGLSVGMCKVDGADLGHYAGGGIASPGKE